MTFVTFTWLINVINHPLTRSVQTLLKLMNLELDFNMKSIFLMLTLIATLIVSPVNADEKAVGGVDHIALSVSNLEVSTNFFVNTLGFKVAGRDKKYPAVFLNNGQMNLTLWQTSDETVAFDRKHNVGLHHLAIKVSSFEALDALYETIKAFEGVVIEFSPEPSYGGAAKHMIFREPSGNRIELIHRPNR